jgi:hypothetical protein
LSDAQRVLPKKIIGDEQGTNGASIGRETHMIRTIPRPHLITAKHLEKPEKALSVLV